MWTIGRQERAIEGSKRCGRSSHIWWRMQEAAASQLVIREYWVLDTLGFAGARIERFCIGRRQAHTGREKYLVDRLGIAEPSPTPQEIFWTVLAAMSHPGINSRLKVHGSNTQQIRHRKHRRRVAPDKFWSRVGRREQSQRRYPWA